MVLESVNCSDIAFAFYHSVWQPLVWSCSISESCQLSRHRHSSCCPLPSSSPSPLLCLPSSDLTCPVPPLMAHHEFSHCHYLLPHLLPKRNPVVLPTAGICLQLAPMGWLKYLCSSLDDWCQEKPELDSSWRGRNIIFGTAAVGEKRPQYRTGLNSQDKYKWGFVAKEQVGRLLDGRLFKL